MPKVVFVAPSAYVLSGLATWLDYLVPGLATQGWDVQLALVSAPHHHQPERYLAEHPAEGVVIVHSDTGTAEGRRLAMDRMLDQTRPDIAVSVNIPDLFPAINRRRQQRRPAPRAVMSVHGIEAYLYADARRYRAMLDAVICTNRLACALAGELGGIEPERVFYSACGVRLADEVAAAAQDGLLHIVFSGRLESDQKRAGDLVGIVHALERQGTPFRLEIAGDGPDRAGLEQALAPQVDAGRVLFHGHVPLERLKSSIYPRAHAMVITSSWETGPIVAWEAMAQGIPVVSARYVGLGREGALADHDTALLFDVGDTEGAAAALGRLWSEPGLRLSLSRAARGLVADRYSIPVSVAAWSSSLLAVLDQPGRGVADLPPAPDSGRLDRWLGPALAERVRRVRRQPGQRAADPGGEWPHSHSKAASDASFWLAAKALDATGLASSARPEASNVG